MTIEERKVKLNIHNFNTPQNEIAEIVMKSNFILQYMKKQFKNQVCLENLTRVNYQLGNRQMERKTKL